MDNMEYKEIIERSIKCQEDNANVVKGLLKVSENMEKNIKDLNDSFVLHSADSKEMKDAILIIRAEMMKWLKWLIFALFITVGGRTIIEELIKLGLFK